MNNIPEQGWKPFVPGKRWAAWLLVLWLSVAASTAHAGDSFATRTTLLRNHEYAEALLQGIGNARASIACSFYLFKTTDTRGNLPRRIAEELVRARKRGVEVTVILEKGSDARDNLNADNRRTAALLGRGGVKVFFDSPRVTTHSKVVVIDSRYLYLGSHNLTQSALRHNNELSVLIDSPELAAEVLAYLERL